MRLRTLVVVALATPSLLHAQSAARTTPDGVMLMFERVADAYGSRLVAAFDSIPAARYGFHPTPAQQTVGYIAQHLENANYELCERFADVQHHRTAKDSLADTVRARWPKDTLVARLQASLRFCDTAMDRAGALQSPALAASLLAFETDLAEHYSQLSSYMRLLGLVPPSALPPRQRQVVDLRASTLAPLVGRYELGPGVELEVMLQNDALFIRSTTSGEAVRLWPESSTQFFVRTADAEVSFAHDASGAVTGLVLRQYGRDRPARRIR